MCESDSHSVERVDRCDSSETGEEPANYFAAVRL
jgi:hypothetical protein